MVDKFSVKGMPPSSEYHVLVQDEPLKEVLDFYSNQVEIPMWMRTFLGYTMKIWLQWLAWKKHMNNRGIPGHPEHREINPDDRVYFLTDKEMMALVHAADAALLGDLLTDDEEVFDVQVARAKIAAAKEINSREEWMYGPEPPEKKGEKGGLQ